MTLRAIHNAARRPRRFLHWLVGQPHLLAQLEDQRSMITAQAAALAALQGLVQASEANICQRLDVLKERLGDDGPLTARDFTTGLQASEASICQRLDVLKERLGDDGPLTARDFTTGLQAEIDRLDGYLVHHSDETRRAVAAGVESASRRIVPVGKDLDAIVTSKLFDIVVPTREEALLVSLSRSGAEAIAPGVGAVLAAHLRSGDVAIDAGANIGLHALGMAAAVGPEGRVVCFEPLPHVAAALMRTLRLNGFAERCEVHMVALSDTSGTADLFAAAHSPLSSLFPLPEDITDDPLAVSLQTLDDVLPPGSRVDVIKVDVEGAEPRIWRGMRRVREENHRLAIVLEWSASHFARSGESPAGFMREILADGFSVAAIDDDQPGRVAPLGVEEAVSLEAGNLVLLRGF